MDSDDLYVRPFTQKSKRLRSKECPPTITCREVDRAGQRKSVIGRWRASYKEGARLSKRQREVFRILSESDHSARL